MRVRSLVTVALLLPGALSAQRSMGGRLGGGRAGGATTLPPTAPVVAREMSYVPRPYSLESYTFISYTQQPDGMNVLSNYGTLSAGTRLDYRLNPHASITGEMTSSLYGGPGTTLSYELGTRLRPTGVNSESKVHTYVDGRFVYVQSFEQYMMTANPTAVNPITMRSSRYGRGPGLIGGGGADFAISRSMWLTSGLWAMRSRLSVAQTSNFARPGNFETYRMTSYRFALGVRWNPMRAVPKYDDPQ